MHNLASSYGNLGEHQRARALHEEVLEFRRRVLPAADIAKSMNHLASICVSAPRAALRR